MDNLSHASLTQIDSDVPVLDAQDLHTMETLLAFLSFDTSNDTDTTVYESLHSTLMVADVSPTDLLISPPLDFIDFFSKFNVYRRANGLHPGLLATYFTGGSRDAPVAFEFRCQVTPSCQFKSNNQTTLKIHEQTCSPDKVEKKSTVLETGVTLYCT